MDGWIKMHRSLLEWEWYDDLPVKVLFIHVLLRANHAPKKWRGEMIETGSLITSLSKLAEETGLSIKQVRNSIKKLEKTGELGTQRGKAWTKITVCKYKDYQACEEKEGTEEGKAGAHEGHSEGTAGATNKNEKNERKKEDNIGGARKKSRTFTPPSLDEVIAYCKERNNNVDPKRWHDFYQSKGWMVGKNKMKDWKAAVRTWEKDSPPGPKKQGGASGPLSPPSDADYETNPFN